MMSEESLPSRLRPGMSSQKQAREVARADFQEELMRLIDPDLSENDLVGFNVSWLYLGYNRTFVKNSYNTVSE